MSATPLPDGLMTHVKTAVRELIAALAVPGTSGAKRVHQITGHSAGHISRWQGDHYHDLPPLDVVFMLEFHVQRPIVSRALAELTGHTLTPSGQHDPAGCLAIATMRAAGDMGRLADEVSDAMRDGEISAAERKRINRAGSEAHHSINRVLRKANARARR